MLAVLLMAAGVGSGCSHSTPKANGDGGPDVKPADASKTDAPDALDAADMRVMCTDDSVKNKDLGFACSCDGQCKSGFCVDGVCCDKACTGTCLTCSLASSPGICRTVPAGSAPRNATDCAKSDASTCGLDGMCDGLGQCRRYPSGSPCRDGSCDGDAVTGRYQCDGNGTCKPAASTVCAPFSCNSSTKACFPTCSVDTDCVKGHTCKDGSCGPKMFGASCQADSECSSGHCADGVCCNVACNSACRSCAMVGHVGTCSPTPQDQPHAMCPVQDRSTCGTTGLCDGLGSCSKYAANTPCNDGATCSGNTLETAATCDGLGTCQPPQAQLCTPYRCTAGACSQSCTTATQGTDCSDNTVCVNESCGPKPDGQACKADAECMNSHCVDGVCCDTACTGQCRSCSLTNSIGKCTTVAAGTADPRQMCMDLGAQACGTNGRCDANGGCQTYATGTLCSQEDCTNDVYTGPSTCNASGQCIKPNSIACNPYHCNANKCFGACTTDNQCIPPNTCGQNGNISSCGPKPIGADCSANNECSSTHCAQGKCCDTACTGACTSCDLPGSAGTCTDVQSGADPQGKCAVQAQSTCGTTGMCTAGQCAFYSSSTVCKAGSCEPGGPPSSALTPPSRCDGNGTCVTPSDQGCAPGRCDPIALMCVNSCTSNSDCTNPNTCVNGSCGLIQKGGTCSTTNQCANGLTCNHDKVCCDQACDGVCETCKPPGGSAGTCTAVAAGQTDPSAMCPVTLSSSCGTNGRCTGDNTKPSTMRCQDWDSSNSCQSQSCANTGANGAGMLTTQSFCGAGSNAGSCFVSTPTACGGGVYKCLNATQCRTTCDTDNDCAGVTCNTVTHVCGTKQAQGAMCNSSADCVSGAANCVDGVCCNSACTGACFSCNLSGSMGMCTAVTAGTTDALCPAAAAGTCGNTGACAAGGVCAKKGSSTTCRAAGCSTDMLSSIPAATCNGTDTCPTSTPVSCGAASCSGSGMSFSQTTAGTCSGGACVSGTTTPCGAFNCNSTTMSCKTACTVDGDCVNGKACDTVAGTCTLTPVGQACTMGAQCKGGNCVDGFCCNTACAATCMACSAARTGGTNGTCANISLNTTDARCVASPPCGNDGTCNGMGACKLTAAGTASTCPAASCMSDMLTPASTCDGLGACTTPAAAACPRGLACADTTTCVSACTAPAVGCASGMTTCNADGSCSP